MKEGAHVQAMDAQDDLLYNEYECPPYELTHIRIFQRIPSVCVRSVSYICFMNACLLNQMETTTLVERQEVVSSILIIRAHFISLL